MGVAASCGDQTITLYLLSKGADPEVLLLPHLSARKPMPIFTAKGLQCCATPQLLALRESEMLGALGSAAVIFAKITIV